MKTIKSAAAGILGAAALVAPGVALAQDAPLEGMIVAHDGSTVVVRSAGADTNVSIDDSAKIRGVSGFLGMERTPHPASDLVRGLAIKVATSDDGATKVTFKERDFKTAQQIHAALVGTEQRVATNAAGISQNAAGVAQNASGVATNSERINNVGELVSAGRAKVYFALGSSAITAEGEQELQTLATQAKSMQSYRLVIVGRADPSGDTASNQRLSEARAAAVTSYLLRSCGVSPERILSPTAVGESEIANDPDPAGTPEEARRVTVTIAVSKALASR